MRRTALAVVIVVTLTGCTTTEKDVAVGTLAGTAIGAIAGGGRGALIGAGVGAVGGLLVRHLRNGYCEYRDHRGHLYTARC